MKTSPLLLVCLIFLGGASSCAWFPGTCTYTNYEEASAVNLTAQDVTLSLCSSAPGIPPTLLDVAGNSENGSSVDLGPGTHGDDGDPAECTEHYPDQKMPYPYAALSEADQANDSLCSFSSTDGSYDGYQGYFAIVKKGSACPTNYVAYDASKNPC